MVMASMQQGSSVPSSGVSDAETESTVSTGDAASISSAQQRRFAAMNTRAGPGRAREAREAVRSSLSTLNPLRGPPMAQPLDYENFLVRNKTALENDPQRDMLLFPRDDITECVVGREERTEMSSVSAQALSEANWLLVKESLRAYSAPHRILAFNYAKFGRDYTRLAQSSAEELSELNYEIDILEDDLAADQVDNGGHVEIIKEGSLLQASENTSAVSLHKNFKKRHCIFRKVGSVVELETSKERGSPGLSCLTVEGVLKGTKKGRAVLELFTSTARQGHVILASENESELDEWFKTLSAVLDKDPSSKEADTESTGSGAADTESLGSEDSQHQWRGRAAQKALIPPKTVRRDLFGIYTDLEPLRSVGCSSFLRSDPLSPRREEPGVPFLVECRCLTLKVPLQGVSGNVYTQALFTVPRPHPEVYLVGRVERILQNESWDPYLKTDSKASGKLQKSMPMVSEKMGRYRSIFAWTARPVFQELLGSAKESLPLYRCEPGKASDADLAKFLSDISRPEKAGKWQALPGASLSLHLDLSIRLEELQNRVTSSFLPVRPFAKPPTGPPIMEIQSFPNASDIEIRPNTHYFNNLYVYPASLRFDGQKTFGKARNIVCSIQLRDTDAPAQAQPLQLTLPVNLTERHHLLFSLGHVAVAAALSHKPSDANTPVESSCGYAWLPLLTKTNSSSDSCRLSMDQDEVEFVLPVAAELPENYLACKPLGLGKGYCGPDIRWVENGRPLLKLKLKLVSSIFSTDPKLQGFFQACQRLSRTGTLADAGDADKTKGGANSKSKDWGEDMTITSKALLNVDSGQLIPFLPVVLNQLLALLPLAPGEEVALSSLRTLVGVVDMGIQSGQTEALRHYVRVQFRAEGGGVHESLAKLLPLLLRPAHADASTTSALLKQAWFFLEITTKSMGQRLLSEGKHKLQRSERFPPEFLYRVESLVQTFISMLMSRHRDFIVETRAANEALAHFIRACLSLVDRGLMLQLIFFYVDKVDRNESKMMREMKLDFLHILTEHEHWVPLCLPVVCGNNGLVRKQAANNAERKTSPVSNKSGGFLHRLIAHVLGSESSSVSESTADLEVVEELKLTVGYFERHFLVGLVFQEMIAALKETKDVRKKSLAVLRNLLAKHAVDPRYSDKNAQSRLATLYMPVLCIVLEILPEIEEVKNLTPTNTSPMDGGGVSPNRDAGKRLTFTGISGGGDASAAPGAIGASVSARNSVVGGGGSGGCAKIIDGKLSVRSGQRTEGGHSRNGSFGGTLPLGLVNLTEKLGVEEGRDLLLCVLHVLKNVQEEWVAVAWRQMTAGQLLEFLHMLEISLDLFKYMGRRVTLRKTCNRLRVSRRTLTLSPSMSAAEWNGDSGGSGSPPFSVLQEAHLAQEVGLIVLDTLASFCRINRDRFESKLAENKEIFGKCQDLYVALLSEYSSEDLRLQALPALGAFVKSFSFTFFTGPLGPICQVARCLLEQLSSRLLSVQRSASALLQILLRSSYEWAGRGAGLGRFGGQLGVALAHLLGEARQLPDSPSFHRGLTLLENLASKEKRTSHFDKLVQDLAGQLRGVLSATGALREAEKDPYRMAELHLRLADSYRGSAALRQAWLESLGKLHEKAGAHSEAGLCHLHICAMMAKELHAQRLLGSCDWDSYAVISENIPREENVETTGAEMENAGIGLDAYTSRIEKAADLLFRAERYEILGPVYRLVLPIYEKKRNYSALAEAYGNLQRAYSRAVSLKGTGKRSLATYFRVVFYGRFHFGEDNGREWVYKEPGLTSLAEAAERLKNQCIVSLGHNRVQFLSDNDEVESKHMTDENVAYVQITHLEPAPEGSTPADEEDDFWRHSNIKRFKFEARLTEDGGRLDDVTRQGKRRIYLYAARSMPYLLRRLLVVSRREESLTPLQVAVEELRKKSAQLRRTLTLHSTDAKRLQLQLQGAVQTTVNAGPLAYAQAFTQPPQRKRYGAQGVDKLKFAFRELVEVCGEALEANSEMIKGDQVEYQKMLEESFATLVHKLGDLFQEELLPLREEEEGIRVENNTAGNRSSLHVFDTIAGAMA